MAIRLQKYDHDCELEESSSFTLCNAVRDYMNALFWSCWEELVGKKQTKHAAPIYMILFK